VTSEPKAATGVYFRREDYAGLWRRFLIDAVDFPIVLALSALVLVAPVATGHQPHQAPGLFLALLAAVWFGYFVLLKGSRYRTAGYVLGGARIVNLRGDRPSYGSLALRLVFLAVGPVNAVLDVFWLTGDLDRQALRDKFASTYVVLKDAVPAGTGPIRLRIYTFSGMTFLFREVQRPARAA
jgi:uncharacterized RDD family membrane protein YckC